VRRVAEGGRAQPNQHSSQIELSHLLIDFIHRNVVVGYGGCGVGMLSSTTPHLRRRLLRLRLSGRVAGASSTSAAATSSLFSLCTRSHLCCVRKQSSLGCYAICLAVCVCVYARAWLRQLKARLLLLLASPTCRALQPAHGTVPTVTLCRHALLDIRLFSSPVNAEYILAQTAAAGDW